MTGGASFSSCNSKNSVGANKRRFGNQRPRVGLRRRKRVANGYGGKVLTFSNDRLAAIDTTPIGLSASITTPDDSVDGWETSKEIELPKQGSHGFEVDDDPFTKNKIKKDFASAGFECWMPDRHFDDGDKNAFRVFEQASHEEHEARTALYLELEKERIAAATAADEAMAMILRLQEEKATIEMEARQYQRMIEEKFAYDAEEMNILKEILLRREREKHFLEKEVEAYKKMFCENVVSDMDMYDMEAIYEQETSNMKQLVMSKQIAESVGEKEKTMLNIDFSEYGIRSVGSPNDALEFGKELPVAELSGDPASLNYTIEENHANPSRNIYEINQELEVKGVASENKNPDHQKSYVQSDLSTTPSRSDWHEKAINTRVEEEQGRESSPHPCLTPKAIETKIIFPYNNEKMEKHGEDLHGTESGTNFHPLGVNVINDKSDLPQTCNNRTIGGLETEAYRRSSSLDRPERLPPCGPSRVKSLPPTSRRSSMSSFDYERLIIDNEVGWLRERLKIVQQGREKLNFPAGHKEREHFQLQILENIANQLREIRQLNEPRKFSRRASLPPQSSKVMSKKRNQMGVPGGLLRSI
ncbi:Ankyrin repeat-containing protein, putative isoform 1 [Hibiscus syriacus]|uniref:Ankyrin repeat-containing protein, putative isoform 1 n=2 Tax=Hibiscus syriacus TaxID=106335 RepID=A0A6A2ZWQ3_HIBSY|nr:Ankyrin repeat-containing protein, putative isoform 1 [Hibiscus syriacus]